MNSLVAALLAGTLVAASPIEDELAAGTPLGYGRIARAARAKTVIAFHFSPRYEGREAELVAELEAGRGS